MAGITLRVDPEVLRRESQAFGSVVSDIKNRFSSILTISEKSCSYWLGEAGDSNRTGFAAFREGVDYLTRSLEDHPKNLLRMAGIYEASEQNITATNTELQTNQIV